MSDFDDDAPYPRRWGSTDPFRIHRAFRHGAGADTSRRPDTVVPLADIAASEPLPAPARPQRVPEPEPDPTPRLELVVTTDDGVPVEGVSLRVADEFGSVYDLTTDAEGIAKRDVKYDVPHTIRLNKPFDLSKIASAERPATPPATALRIDPRDTAESTIRLGSPVTIVLVRPLAVIVSLDGWREGQAVLVFGAARSTPNGPNTVRGIFRTVLAGGGDSGPLFAVGHADTKGGKDDNAKLAAERATSVALYLTGDREAWAQHAYDNANMTTLKAALAWAAVAFGIPCDPGKIGPGWNGSTADALNGLRSSVGIPYDAKYGPADWAVLYDLYDVELAAILYTDVAGLQARKQAIRLSDDDCGERWPTAEPELDGYASAENRRVDLVLVRDGQAPRASIDEIYDGTFTVKHLTVPPEAKVRLRSVTTTMVSIGQTRITAMIVAIRADLVADEFGVVEFTALRGETITVLDCTDLWSASRMVWGAFADVAELKGAGEGDP